MFKRKLSFILKLYKIFLFITNKSDLKKPYDSLVYVVSIFLQRRIGKFRKQYIYIFRIMLYNTDEILKEM